MRKWLFILLERFLSESRIKKILHRENQETA